MRKNIKTITLLFCTLSLAGSCNKLSEENIKRQDNTSEGLLTKAVNSPEGASGEILLVKFREVPANMALEKISLTEGVQGIERVFKSFPGKESLEKRFGLDRWYVVTTGDNCMRNVAEQVSKHNIVQTIEFCHTAAKASDCISYPYKPDSFTVSTMASENNIFNDNLLKDQWHYINLGNKSFARDCQVGADINVKDVWRELTAGDPEIIVAVVDEGVDYDHPDLKANMWTNDKELNGQPGVDDDGNGYIDDIHGFNFVQNGAISWDAPDDSGHGTHCAGTIGAVNNNAEGVCGVAGGTGKNDGVRIMSCQIFDGKEGGNALMSSQAIKYAADMGASVISCSYGYKEGVFTSDKAYEEAGRLEADAIRYFEASKNNDVLDGSIAVFAAGNDGRPCASYPGALHDIICVSAFSPDYLPAYYTNYGPGCKIVAPGGEFGLSIKERMGASEILSTLPPEKNEGNPYGYMQGTSMACPHVSGIVALGLSYAKKLGKHFTVQEFKNMILSSANDFNQRFNSTKKYQDYTKLKPFDLYPYVNNMGTGSIDTWNLMMKIEGIPCLIAETGREQWLSIDQYFGTSSKNLTFLGEVEISDKDKDELGLATKPYIKHGKLYIHPTKTGSCRVKIKAVAGGTEVGGDQHTGGMEMYQEVSIIARPFKSVAGGWL